MNGEKGKVQSFNAATGRYAVQIYSGGPPFTRTRTRINTHPNSTEVSVTARQRRAAVHAQGGEHKEALKNHYSCGTPGAFVLCHNLTVLTVGNK
jgi:hypothetical protein